MNVKGLFTAMLVIVVLLIGCSNENVDTERDDVDEQELDNKEEQEVVVSPLTGLEVFEGENKRIVSVMVNNHPDARPQTGLSKADIVFELLVEGSITRFLALYQSEQPDIVGPVRSAREYYIDLANRYDALYVYHGAIWFVEDLVTDQGVDSIKGTIHDNDGYLFKRESFRKAPHNSYLQFNAVYDVAKEKGYETTYNYEALPFTEQADSLVGDHAENIEIIYPGKKASEAVEYIYNEQSEDYFRSEAKQQTVELNTDEPIVIDNVFIIEADHEVIDSEGRRSINLNDGGRAYLIQKGIIQELEWESIKGRLIPVKDGEVVGFVPGKTWINVVPSNPGIDQVVNVQ